jgi:hypothetical protein
MAGITTALIGSFPSSIVTNGLLLNLDASNSASYPGTGTSWFDLSGNGRTMTLYNSPTFVSSGPKYFDFDGVNDYSQLTNNGLGTGALIPHTLEMWAWFDIFGPNRWWLAVIAQFGQGSNHWIGSSQTGTQFGAWSAPCQRSPNLLGVGQWLHLVTTFDGTNLIAYVNNVAGDACIASGFNFSSTDLTFGLRLGGEAHFDGRIGTARLYNRGLTPAEVSNNFSAERSRFGV